MNPQMAMKIAQEAIEHLIPLIEGYRKGELTVSQFYKENGAGEFLVNLLREAEASRSAPNNNHFVMM